MDRQISVPIKKEDAVSLRAGDYVTLTGTIYTAGSSAHRDAGKRHLLYGTVPGKRGTSYRICGTNNGEPYG